MKGSSGFLIQNEMEVDEYKETELKRTPCKGLRCMWFKFDFFDNAYDYNHAGFCGLHGRHKVEEGELINLDMRGGCGYFAKHRNIQTSIFDLL